MSDVVAEGDERKRGPSAQQYFWFVGVCWAFLPLVYFEDYGWPGAPPRVPYGGNWITLDLTGLITMAYVWFAGIYTVLATCVFVRARRMVRRMSWKEYVLFAPTSVLALIGVWMLYVAVH